MTTNEKQKWPPKLFVEERSLKSTTEGKCGVVAWYDTEAANHDGVFYSYIPEIQHQHALSERDELLRVAIEALEKCTLELSYIVRQHKCFQKVHDALESGRQAIAAIKEKK